MITRLNIGGPGQQALLLKRELDSWPTVLAVGTPEPLERELPYDTAEIERLPLVRNPAPIQDILALRRATALIERVRPRVVHTHTAKAGAVGRLAATRARPRPLIVHTFHGHSFAEYFPSPIEAAFVQVERYLARRSDALIAVSSEVRDALIDRRVGTPEKIRIIELGLDLQPFFSTTRGTLRRQLRLDTETPLVASVGRLVPIKRCSDLLFAVARLSGVHLAVLGDGEEKNALIALASTLGIADRTHFTGWDVNVASSLHDVDVVALSSLNEGTPASLIEAHASGKPVVATNVGGVGSVVQEGTTGFLVPPRDPDALANRLGLLINDATLRRRMGEAGRKHVVQRYSKERLLRDIETLYSELTNRGEAWEGEVDDGH